MKNKSVFSAFLAVAMMFSLMIPAYATTPESGVVTVSTQGYSVTDIPHTVYQNESDMGFLPPITREYYYGPTMGMNPLDIGVGVVVPRVRTWEEASDGLFQTDESLGSLASTAGTFLGFSSHTAAMTVGSILSAVGLVVDNVETPVQAKTYVSYLDTYRDGEGRWSSDPNTDDYYFLGVRTGQRLVYKHIWAAKQVGNRWVSESKDYPNPVRTLTSTHFNDLDWILEQGRQNVELGKVYDEIPWGL